MTGRRYANLIICRKIKSVDYRYGKEALKLEYRELGKSGNTRQERWL